MRIERLRIEEPAVLWVRPVTHAASGPPPRLIGIRLQPEEGDELEAEGVRLWYFELLIDGQQTFELALGPGEEVIEDRADGLELIVSGVRMLGLLGTRTIGGPVVVATEMLASTLMVKPPPRIQILRRGEQTRVFVWYPATDHAKVIGGRWGERLLRWDIAHEEKMSLRDNGWKDVSRET